jgi:hypothetical protein
MHSVTHERDSCDQIVLDAVRAWFRPHCAAGTAANWQEVLTDNGFNRHATDCFNRVMSEWARIANRQIDIRCRCSVEMSADEGRLLEVMAQFQTDDLPKARDKLISWLPTSHLSQLENLLQGLAARFLNVGVDLDLSTRPVTYLH